MPVKRGLGRGLGALINDQGEREKPPQQAESGITRVPVERIRANPWQPRRAIEQESLQELAQSIKARGVLQPLVVRSAGDEYELIAGQRRLRAAIEAGLTNVPVMVVEAEGSDSLEIALIENVQREDLNVLEEAEAYQTLADKFGMSQEDIATRVGKARASISNAVRLLGLPETVRAMLADGRLSAGHAKILTGLEIAEEQVLYAGKSVDDALSVRGLEKLIQSARRVPRTRRTAQSDIPATHLSFLSDRLHQHFGTRVKIRPCRTFANGKKDKGSLEIDFHSNDELDRILEILGLTDV